MYHHCDKIRETISPYNPNASAKIRIKIIPTNILSCCAFALTPASPTTPIASPAASELNPQHKPALSEIMLYNMNNCLRLLVNFILF